jgi:hypothetical protein
VSFCAFFIAASSLKQSEIGFKDILLFYARVISKSPLSHHPNAILMVDSKVIGNLNDLIIPKFEISGIGLTKLHPVAL